MSIEAMKQALEALENIKEDCSGCEFEWLNDYPLQAKAAEVLHQAIAKLESQEPVSTLWQHGETGRFRVTTPDSITDCDARWFKVGDLYIHPPQRTWQGLTDEDLIECERLADICHRKHMGSIRGQQLSSADQFLWHYARAIEAKLKEKNND